MKTFTKALVGTVVAGTIAISSASPALARDYRDHRDNNGVDAGDVIAGALIIGGIAAIAASAGDQDNGYRDNGYRDNGYRDIGYRDNGYDYDRSGYRNDHGRYNNRDWRGGNPRNAVERCVVAAEREAGRYSYGRADVTDIRSVRQTRYGYEVRGRIAVNSQGRNWRQGEGNYGRGWNGDYRGWNTSMRGYDSGAFTCRIDGGRTVDVDFNGMRGLR